MKEPTKYWDTRYCFTCGCVVSDADVEANKKIKFTNYPALYSRCNSCFTAWGVNLRKIQLKRALLK
jgi:hypothetical protein